jgi:hypothetical protein
MKEILQLFRRDAEHGPPHPSATQYDLGVKPRILKEISTSSSVGSSKDGSVDRKTTPPTFRPSSAVAKEDSVFGRRW